MKTLSLDKIRIDGGTQPRESIDTAYVDELAEIADKLPPAVVFFDGVEHWLGDGFHRYHARRKAGKQTMNVDIRNGTLSDAVVFAVGANASHGLRRTNADKRRAVGMLLALKGWGDRSSEMIATTCGVSRPFVEEFRANMQPLQVERVGKDGKTRKLPSKTAMQDAKPEVERIPMAGEEGGVSVPPPSDPAEEDILVDALPESDPAEEMPKEIAAIFTRACEIERLAQMASNIKAAVKKMVEDGDELAAEINLSQVQADCSNLHRAFRFAKPHAVCPYCQGRGRETKDCKCCGGRGWVGKGRFDAAPEEMKK